jgi:hypothetical protein
MLHHFVVNLTLVIAAGVGILIVLALVAERIDGPRIPAVVIQPAVAKKPRHTRGPIRRPTRRRPTP